MDLPRTGLLFLVLLAGIAGCLQPAPDAGPTTSTTSPAGGTSTATASALPPLVFRVDEAGDQLVVDRVGGDYDWNRIEVSLKSQPTDPPATLNLGDSPSPFHNEPAMAEGTANDVSATPLRATTSSDRIFPQDFLAFCSSTTVTDVTVKLVDGVANLAIGEFTFRSVVACASTASPTSATSSTPPAPVTVQVKCNAFDPNSKSVAKGTTVTWQHQCGGHTVTIHKSGDPTGQYLHDASLSSGTTSFQFTQAGTHHVFCRPHSDGENGNYADGMVSTVTVT